MKNLSDFFKLNINLTHHVHIMLTRWPTSFYGSPLLLESSKDNLKMMQVDIPDVNFFLKANPLKEVS